MSIASEGWREIEFPGSQAVELGRAHGKGITLHWTEFDTSDDGDREALSSFVTRPLPALMGRSRYEGLTLDGIDESWHVVTSIPNHQLGLNPRITIATALCIDDEKTCHVTLAKQKEKKD